MDIRLQLLDSFIAQGSDGQRYKVCGYDRLALVPGTAQQWEPTGVVEYRLDDHRTVQVAADGTMTVLATGVRLDTAGAASRMPVEQTA
jgi:hypothetical protein